MKRLKADLISLLHEHMDNSEVKERCGISIDFIADGMIESISKSARIGQVAEALSDDFEIPAHLLDKIN